MHADAIHCIVGGMQHTSCWRPNQALHVCKYVLYDEGRERTLAFRHCMLRRSFVAWAIQRATGRCTQEIQGTSQKFGIITARKLLRLDLHGGLMPVTTCTPLQP